MNSKTLTTLLLAGVVLSYPLLVYVGLGFLPPWVFGALALVITCWRWLLSRKGGLFAPFAGALLTVAVIQGTLLALDSSLAALSYPVLMNFAFAWIFGYSLRYPPSVVERIANLQTPPPPPEARSYLRSVSQAWFLFLLINGFISAWSAWYGDTALWALYNGLIAYVLMGLLAGGELLIRGRFRRRLQQAMPCPPSL